MLEVTHTNNFSVYQITVIDIDKERSKPGLIYTKVSILNYDNKRDCTMAWYRLQNEDHKSLHMLQQEILTSTALLKEN